MRFWKQFLSIFANNQATVPVPPFFVYSATEEDMDQAQLWFYRHWLESWNNEITIDIDGQYSYLFCYMGSVFATRNAQEIINKLIRLRSAYPQVNSKSQGFMTFCTSYIADAHVILNQYDAAITLFAELDLPDVHPVTRNKLLSLKLQTGADVTGHDILTLFGAPNLTQFGKENIDSIAQTLDKFMAEYYSENNTTFLENMITEYECVLPPESYPMFGYHSGDCLYTLPHPSYYYFHTLPTAYPFAQDLVRGAENTYREEIGIPRIGEGWVSEIELYRLLSASLPDLQVIHHASLEWLDRQHLDIFIPELRVAIEYQGRQHDEPIEFFGGEAAFKETQVRDERKRRLCKQNNVKLIYVRPGYDLDKVIEQIKPVQ